MTLAQPPTVWGLVEARAAATPDAVMVIDESDRTLTFAEYRAASERAAAGLAAHGVGDGDTVAWQLPTWIESLVLMAALARLGARQLPLLPIYRERELAPLLRRANTKVWCIPSTWGGTDYRALARQVQPGRVELIVCDRELPSGAPESLPPPPRPDTARLTKWIYATSGTNEEHP